MNSLFPKPETPTGLPTGERWLAAVLVLVAVAIATVSRLGSVADSLLPAWVRPQMPMTPMVADAVWLLGLALIVLNWRHRLPAWRAIMAGTTGLLLVGQFVLNARAGSIILVSLSLMAAVVLLVALAPERRSRLKAGGLVVALLLLAGHGILLLGQHFGVPLFIDPQLAPAAWTTSLALTALSFALVISCGAARWFYQDILGEAPEENRLVPLLVKRQRRWALLVLGFTLSVVAAGGYAYLRSAIKQRRAILAAELTQIVDLKTAQIEAWLRERKADAVTLAQAPFLEGDRVAVERYLENFRRVFGYRQVGVLDLAWTPVATAPAGAQVVLPVALIEQAMQGPDVLVEDLASAPDGAVVMGFIAPRRKADGAFAGAVRLRVEASAHLFPVVQSWPVKSETAETLLIRREGLSVLFLNDLRFQPNAALSLRYPLGQRDLPAAVAALERRVELSEGVDYRGVPVLWLARPIAGTTWVILAKMDQVEAYAALRTDTWRLAGGFAVGLLAVGLLVGNYWRNRQRYYERQHIETEQERRAAVERLALVLKHAQDVILLFDENKRIVEANDRALAVYDRTPQEIRQLTATDLRAEQTKGATEQDFSRALAADGVTFETLHQRKDGTVFPVEVSSRAVEIQGRRHVFSIIRDITQRKAHEEEIERLNRMYFIISQVNQVLVRANSRDELFREVCRVLVQVGRFRIAWIGWLDPASRFIEPIATAGDESGYVPGIRISADAAVPEGRGPSGTAFREGRTYVCNDFFADPTTLPWRERAARSGFQSILAVPLRCEGQILGLLNVYADSRNFFAPHEITLLEETAGDISYALDVFAGAAKRRAAEERLRESQEHLSFLVSATPAVIYTFSAKEDPRVTFVSPNVAKLVGWKAEDFLGSPSFWWEHVHADDRAAAAAALARLTGEENVTREYRFQQPDGSWRWTLDEVRLLRDASGQPVEYIGSWIDITERKRIEEAFKREEARFRFIFERAPVGISLILENGEVVVNPAHARISGVPVEDSNTPGVFAKASHPEDYARQLVAAEPFARNEVDHYTFEKRYLHPDGRTVWASLTSHWYINPATRQRQVLTIVTDISEQKRNEEEAKRQVAKFKFIFEHLPIGISLRTKAYGLEVNPAHVRLTGVAAADSNLPGVFARASHPDDYARQLQITDGFLRGDTNHLSLEKRYLHPDGKVVWVDFASHRLFDLGTGEPQTLTTLVDITDRKVAEEALRAREEIFSNIVNQAVDAMALIDPATGRFIEFNRAAHENLGYTREEFAELGLGGIQAEHSPAEIGENVRRIMTEGGVTFETRHRHRSGELRNARVSARGFVLRGRPCIAGVWTDITESKHMQQALQESEAKFRRLLQMVPQPLGHADGNGRITFINERFQRLFGYTPEEVPTIEQWWQRAYPDPRYAEELAAIWERTMSQALAGNGEMAPLETNVTCKDGRVRTVEISGMILGGEVLVIFVDITERANTERKLRQLSRTIEQAPLSIAITDLTGAIEYVNPRFCEVTGYTLEEVLDQNPRVLKSGKTAPEVYTQMWQTLSRGEIWRGELCNKKKNGDLYYEQAVIAPVTDDNGAITHYVALKEDITERKHRDEALRETQERYRLIAENTSDTIWLYDLAAERYTYCSPAVLRLRGYTAEEVQTQKLTESMTPASAARAAQILPDRLARFAAGDHSIRTEVHEFEQYHRDGHVIATEVSTTLLADDSGRVTQILGVTRDITERRRAEKELQESRDRLIQAEQIARLGNWSIDLATGKVTWSDEMYRLLDLDPATTTPSVELYHSFLPPEDRDLLERRFTEALTTRQRFVLGTRLILRSGQLKYAEGTGEVIVDAAGQPVRVIGTVQDITERRQIEIELHELVKGLRVLRAISSALEQRSTDRVALLALVVRELPSAMTHPADAQAEIVIEGQRQAAGATGVPLARLTVPISINDRVVGEVSVSYVQPHAAGDEGPFHVREREVLESIARTIGLGLGEREAFAAVQQFNAELEGKVAARTAELAARNRQIESLFNAIPDTVMRLGGDGTVLFSQRAPESPRLAAITPVPNVAPAYRATGEFLAACRELVQRARAENGTVANDIEVGTPGGPVAIELRSAPTGSDEFVVFARDISARKRLEAEVAAMLAKEREISEMKTRFISVTSHEFRTPMAAAMGSVELLHNHFARMTPEKREELFTRIYGSLHRMTDMLDDILLLNRMDANRVEVRPTVIDLQKFVHSAVDEIRLGDREHHRFALEAEGDLAEFVTDPGLLHHILSNLLSNAGRYSPANTTVTTRVTATATAVTIAVTDQGIGIPEADRQRIFEPFERGSNVGQIKGTGLGLNIVKRMIGLLGGSISLESAPGGGSRFQVVLPRLAPPAPSS